MIRCFRQHRHRAPGYLDLRNNLKFTSFGHLNVLRASQVMQLPRGSLPILGAQDGGTCSARTTRGTRLKRSLSAIFSNERLRDLAAPADGRGRTRGAALAGAPHIMKMQRGPFEALLLEIAEFAEEWLTSAQSGWPGAAHAGQSRDAVGRR